MVLDVPQCQNTYLCFNFDTNAALMILLKCMCSVHPTDFIYGNAYKNVQYCNSLNSIVLCKVRKACKAPRDFFAGK